MTRLPTTTGLFFLKKNLCESEWVREGEREGERGEEKEHQFFYYFARSEGALGKKKTREPVALAVPVGVSG